MAETLSMVDIGHGTVIRIGRGGGPTWTQIMGGETAGVPSQPPNDVPASHFQSPNRTDETIPGMKPIADYSLELQYWPGSATDLLLSELADLTGAGNREIVIYEITPNGGRTMQYMSYVNSYVPSSSVADKQMVEVQIKVMARIISEAAPTNTLLPSISGIAQVGETLTAIEGAWTDAPSFTYDWAADGTPIGGATAKTYVPIVGQIGDVITVVVTGTNSEGSASATSASTAAVIAA